MPGYRKSGLQVGKVLVGVAIGFVFATIAVAGYIVVYKMPTVDRLRAELTAQATELTQEASAVTTNVKLDADEAHGIIVDSKAAGDAVARLQNDKVTLWSGMTLDEDALKTNVKALDPYFDTAAKNAGKMRWASPDVASTWAFATGYTIELDADSASGSKFPCVWLCTDDDNGRLLAFVLADWNTESELFSNVTVHKTSYGVEHEPADDWNENPSEVEVVDESDDPNVPASDVHGDDSLTPEELAQMMPEGDDE